MSLLSTLRTQIDNMDYSNFEIDKHHKVLIDIAKQSKSHIDYDDLLKWLSIRIYLYMTQSDVESVELLDRLSVAKGLARAVVYDFMSEYDYSVVDKIVLAGWGKNYSRFGAIKPLITQEEYQQLYPVEQYAISLLDELLRHLIDLVLR